MDGAPTDLQLEVIVRHIARLHLEIERGLRDPAQLIRLMSPQAELQWQRTRERGGRLPGGPVRDADLGPVQLRRDHEGLVYAAVTTPTQRGRWGALTLVLHAEGRTVSIRQAKRLHAGLDYGRTIRASEDQLLDRLDHAMEERRLVLAAIEATRVPTHADPPRGSTSPSSDTWKKVLAQLDTEITTLMQTDLHRHFHAEPQRPRLSR
ncbi:hypothetical protein [Nitriliruptor alkaliphilus]|uniref:hypothetical protein n=1 Tax=Nitriliruptor alkaliphilus TaxID=427918 RepID=UPI000698C9F1|nr:hypothetical protein [Nitriliruptor alkaliphilus]